MIAAIELHPAVLASGCLFVFFAISRRTPELPATGRDRGIGTRDGVASAVPAL